MKRRRAAVFAGRDVLKGLAILWVALFHAQLGFSGVGRWVQQVGYGGVDMLVFLSGMGLYASLERSPSLGGYMRRRAARLLPAYLPFCALWLAVMIPALGMGPLAAVQTAAGNMLMLGYLGGVPQMISWYVSLLAMTVLLAPFVHAALHAARKPAAAGLTIAALAFALGLCWVGDERYMAISRLPVFVLGMTLGDERVGRRMSGAAVTGLSLAALAVGAGALWATFSFFPSLLASHALYWHPFALIAPAMCLLLGIAFDKGRGQGPLSRALAFLGRASLEIFLFNVWMELAVKRFKLAQNPWHWALWTLGSVVAGCLYHALTVRCTRACRQRRNAA